MHAGAILGRIERPPLQQSVEPRSRNAELLADPAQIAGMSPEQLVEQAARQPASIGGDWPCARSTPKPNLDPLGQVSGFDRAGRNRGGGAKHLCELANILRPAVTR